LPQRGRTAKTSAAAQRQTLDVQAVQPGH
jgi:hypothetical protein